jgi:hypothetical protein
MNDPYDVIKNLILGQLGTLSQTPSGFHKRDCMMCATRGHNPDTRKRFGIIMNGSSIGVNCFNCGFGARWESGESFNRTFIEFLTVIGVPPKEIKKLQFHLFKHKKLSDSDVELISIERDITKKWTPVELPEYAHSLQFWTDQKCTDDGFLKVRDYAISRDIVDLDKVYWSPIKDRQYYKRLIIPFMYKGEVVGHTARLRVTPRNKMIPKYVNVMPPCFLYNVDGQVERNEYLILCEGILDAFHLNGIGALHNSINDDQARIINSLGKKVILTPHRDAAGDELIKDALKYGWGVSFPKWDKEIKDASDAVAKYGRILTLQSIIESAEYKKFNIKLKRNFNKHGESK